VSRPARLVFGLLADFFFTRLRESSFFISVPPLQTSNVKNEGARMSIKGIAPGVYPWFAEYDQVPLPWLFSRDFTSGWAIRSAW
jgi:hypothetical protein